MHEKERWQCMPITDFLTMITENPMLAVSALLTLGVILVNGWTDAPNAIATCVSTRAIGVRKAIVMAAIFNFFGVLVMTAINASVAMTIYNIADFGNDARLSLIALCAAMSAIVIWAVAAWYFGIPTSESHALIAGITGAAVAIHGNFSGINASEWGKVLIRDRALDTSRLCVRLSLVKAYRSPVPRQEPYEIGEILLGRADRRRSGNGIHARGAGRSEIYGDISPRRIVRQAGIPTP